MRVIRSVKHIGTGWLVGAVGLAGGIALATPPAVSATIHAVMAGADGGQPTSPSGEGHGAGASGSAGLQITPASEPATTQTTTTPPGAGTHPSGGTPPTTQPTEGSTTTEPTTRPPHAPPPSPSGPSSPSGDHSGSAGCATAAITSVSATAVDGGRAVLVKVMMSGDVGWMSAAAEGTSSASLQPVTGGFQGTLTAPKPIVAGTIVHVGTCGGALQASTAVQGGQSGGASEAPAPGGPSPTTTIRQPEAPGCATAALSLLTAVLVDDGHGVEVTVRVSGDVGSMSAVVDGSLTGSLQPITGGFQGTLTAKGSALVQPGAPVLVGTCSGALQAHTTVVAA